MAEKTQYASLFGTDHITTTPAVQPLGTDAAPFPAFPGKKYSIELKEADIATRLPKYGSRIEWRKSMNGQVQPGQPAVLRVNRNAALRAQLARGLAQAEFLRIDTKRSTEFDTWLVRSPGVSGTVIISRLMDIEDSKGRTREGFTTLFRNILRNNGLGDEQVHAMCVPAKWWDRKAQKWVDSGIDIAEAPGRYKVNGEWRKTKWGKAWSVGQQVMADYLKQEMDRYHALSYALKAFTKYNVAAHLLNGGNIWIEVESHQELALVQKEMIAIYRQELRNMAGIVAPKPVAEPAPALDMPEPPKCEYTDDMVPPDDFEDAPTSQELWEMMCSRSEREQETGDFMTETEAYFDSLLGL